MNDSQNNRVLARKALDNAATELERALYNIGYQAGWAAAVQQLTNAMPPIAPQALTMSTGHHKDVPARELVIDFIRKTPGQRGSEIVQALRESAGIVGNTIRTAIFRLKEADLIRNEDGRWFANHLDTENGNDPANEEGG